MAIERHGRIPCTEAALVPGRVEGSFDFVYGRATPFEQVVLERLAQALKPDPGRHVVAKLRCTDVRAGHAPCMTRWHLDHVKSPNDPRPPERHAIYVSSIPTLFSFYGERVVAIDPEWIYTYGRVWHRPSLAVADCRRLLVRLSEGDVVRPHNQSDR